MIDEEMKREKKLRKLDRKQARQEEWEKIKSLGFKKRIGYFWDYYRFVPVLIAGAVVLIIFISNYITGFRTKTMLYVTLMNPQTIVEDSGLESDFLKEIGPLDRYQDLQFDGSLMLYEDPEYGVTQQDSATGMKLAVYAQGGLLDVFLGPGMQMEFLMKQGFFKDLDDFLSEEEKASFEKMNGPDGKLYAIRIDDCSRIREYGIYPEGEVWFALAKSPANPEMSRRFLDFLMDRTKTPGNQSEKESGTADQNAALQS